MRFILVLSVTITMVFAQWGWNNPGWNNPGWNSGLGFAGTNNLNAQIAQSQANTDWSIAQANQNVARADMNAARIAARSGNPLGAALDRQAAQAAEGVAQQYRWQGIGNQQAARQDLFGGPFGGGGYGRGWEGGYGRGWGGYHGGFGRR